MVPFYEEWARLKTPSEINSPLKDVTIMDGIFERFHMCSSGKGPNLIRTPMVTKKLIQKIQDRFSDKYPPRMIKKFAISRTIFRMRWLQYKEKAKHLESLRSLTKRNDYRY